MDNNTIPIERKKKLDKLFECLSVIAEDTHVYLCDMKYNYSKWSKTLVETFGLPSEYMIDAGTIWEEHIHPDDRQVYHDGIESIFAGESAGHDMQYRACKPNGEYEVCTCRGIVIEDEEGNLEYFGGSIRNHSEQRQIDTLTGLRNQYGFFEDLSYYINNHIEITILLVGIGRFAKINELYGYKIGNLILQKAGRSIMQFIGNKGKTYRLDGTKFAVISTTKKPEEMIESYDELRQNMLRGIRIDDDNIILEMFAGMIHLDDFNTDDQTVYACLNFAFDESKETGHGEIVEFKGASGKDEKQSIEKLYTIRNSITHGFEGFYLLYQPIIEAKTEKIIGAEALLRWKNDEYGMVPPDSFIPILEKDTLFPALGEWILKTALEAALNFVKLLPNFVINVNLSYSQLEKGDFVEIVKSVIDSSRYPAEQLCLEITERCRLLDMGLLKNTMIQLKSDGIRIALDDFGTGFSSMGLVKSLPFDTIKIDRSFVQKIEEDEREKKLVNKFTEVASLYDAKVCVEGIETSGMADILRNYSVHSFQGYYYSKPVEEADIIKRIKEDYDI